MYGTLVTGNQRQDWLNAKYILMWGWNPAEMRDGTNSDYFVKLAREAGAHVVCIDPRHSLSAPPWRTNGSPFARAPIQP